MRKHKMKFNLFVSSHWYNAEEWNFSSLYCDVKMSAMACKITSLTIVDSTIHPGADQRKHQSSASPDFVRGFHRWPMNSPHKWPVKGKCFHLMTPLWNAVTADDFKHKESGRHKPCCWPSFSKIYRSQHQKCQYIILRDLRIRCVSVWWICVECCICFKTNIYGWWNGYVEKGEGFDNNDLVSMP